MSMLLVNSLTIVRKSGQNLSRLMHNYTPAAANRQILLGKKCPLINSNVDLQSKCTQSLRNDRNRFYSDEKVKQKTARIQTLRSRLSHLFVFGDWKLEDIYSIYLLAFFGGLGIFFLSVDMNGGFAENFDDVKAPVNIDDTRN